MAKQHPDKATPRKLKAEERRRQVAGLYLRRCTTYEIAKQLGVSQSTVSRDLDALRKEWQDERLTDTEAVVLRELAELDAIERDAALQFIAGKQRKTGPDAEWLYLRLRAKERRAKILGLERANVNHTGGLEVEINDAATALDSKLAQLATRAGAESVAGQPDEGGEGPT